MGDMLSGQHWPENEKIIRRMREQIEGCLGQGAWGEVTQGNPPTADMENRRLAERTGVLLANLDRLAPPEARQEALCRVRHGLAREDFLWAREKFLAYQSIDAFADAMRRDAMEELRGHLTRGTLFYDQPIDQTVFDYAESMPDLLYGRRVGNQIWATAIPYRVKEYLAATDPVQKRYCMCHCQFARESILGGAPVSSTMCHCSLGHNLMFWETALDTPLRGEIVASALGGDCTCQFAIDLPPEILKRYA